VQSSSALRAIVDYEDVVIAICVQNHQRAEHGHQLDDSIADIPDSQINSALWNFTSADAATLHTLGAWPLNDSNPFLLDLLHKRASSVLAPRHHNILGLYHHAPFYHGIITSIQDKFRFVFVRHNPSARGSERPCLRATQCTQPGCMSLLRAGLQPMSANIANVTRLLPSSTNQPWLITSSSDAHTASAAEISKAANLIAEWAATGTQFRLLEELTQDNFALYTFARPTVIFFTGVADNHNVAIKRVLRAAAAKFLRRVRFGHLNGLRYHGLALKMGSNHPAPSIVLVDNSKNFSAVTYIRLPGVSLSRSSAHSISSPTFRFSRVMKPYPLQVWIDGCRRIWRELFLQRCALHQVPMTSGCRLHSGMITCYKIPTTGNLRWSRSLRAGAGFAKVCPRLSGSSIR
jgi:hypothetical protein